MKRFLLKSMVAAAVVSAFSGAATAGTSTIMFDPDGAGAGGAISITGFDWTVDNALSVGSIDANGFRNGATSQLYAQSALANFLNGTSQIASTGPYQFTFQTSFQEIGFVSGRTVDFLTTGSGENYFRIFADAATTANNKTGLGYGDGLKIFEGYVAPWPGSGVAGTSSYTEAFVQSNPLPGLDGNTADGDDDGGIVTREGQGSASFLVVATFWHPDFFKDGLLSLTVDFTTQLKLRFDAANPSDQVVGQTPRYGVNGVNGAACAPVAGVDNSAVLCDFHLQQDASSTFNTTVPEPATLGLLGLGAVGIGLIRRRRGAK